LDDLMTGDELDAVTCALVGKMYLEGNRIAVGDPAEILMVLPKPQDAQLMPIEKKGMKRVGLQITCGVLLLVSFSTIRISKRSILRQDSSLFFPRKEAHSLRQ